jgi:hypothetical protein
MFAQAVAMLRLRENHVPQNTPITRANNIMVESCTVFSFMLLA